jgi:hypothetical protein
MIILDRLDIDTDSVTRGTGCAIKPAGACKGEIRVPLLLRDQMTAAGQQ